MTDARAQQAREAHEASLAALGQAAVHRERRDALVRALRAEDPAVWTYPALAAAVGCSRELIGVIMRG